MNFSWNDFFNHLNDALIHTEKDKIQQEYQCIINNANMQASLIMNSFKQDWQKQYELNNLRIQTIHKLQALGSYENGIKNIDALNTLSKFLK